MSGVSLLRAGEFHSLALKTDGTVWSWGKNASGQLGDGTATSRTSPVQVSGISGINTIACGTEHSLALKNDGTLWGWGANGSSQLSDGTIVDKTTAVQATGLSTALVAGINDQPENNFDFSIYPNPSSGRVILELPAVKNSTIRVMSVTGQEVYTEATNGGNVELNLDRLSAGMYIVHFSSAEVSGVKRLIIQK
ncbi:MAG: repeat-containing protein [Bacteroidetes bacterium]|nr:repeat-containing protein [Bacteroidota bacterium]